MQTIRVLHVVGSMGVGGIQSLLMNLYRNMDKQKVQFDFLLHFKEGNVFVPEIELLGGRVYYIDNDAFEKKRWGHYCVFWKKFYSEHSEYKIVHGHIRSTSAIYLYYARKAGIFSIAHSHSTTNGYGLGGYLKNILQYPTRYMADYFMGCSDAANKWMFGKKIAGGGNCWVLRNGIDFDKYSFNEQLRNAKREELGLNRGDFIIANVGRLVSQKGQMILLTAMPKLLEYRKDVKLLLIGDGPLKEEYIKVLKNLKIEKSVFLLGARNDVPQLLSAIDVFCMPSVNEGLGIAAIEAQANGCPTLVSSAVPQEAYISNLITQVDDDMDWAEAIINVEKFKNKQRNNSFSNSDYDIKKIASELQDFYLNIVL